MSLNILYKTTDFTIDISSGVVIYGAGRTGRLIYDWISRYGIKCIAMMDKNIRGKYKKT